MARVAHAVALIAAAVALAHHGPAAIMHAEVEPAALFLERSSRLGVAFRHAIGMRHDESVIALAVAKVPDLGIVVVAPSDNPAEAQIEERVRVHRVQPALNLIGTPTRTRHINLRRREVHLEELIFHCTILRRQEGT
jgi:hypothetical protein